MLRLMSIFIQRDIPGPDQKAVRTSPISKCLCAGSLWQIFWPHWREVLNNFIHLKILAYQLPMSQGPDKDLCGRFWAKCAPQRSLGPLAGSLSSLWVEGGLNKVIIRASWTLKNLQKKVESGWPAWNSQRKLSSSQLMLKVGFRAIDYWCGL